MPKHSVDHGAAVPTHSRRRAGLSTWMILNPSAAPALEAAAHALDEHVDPVLITAYSDDPKLGSATFRRRLKVHRRLLESDLKIKSVKSIAGGREPVADCSCNLGASTAHIVLGSYSANVQKLLYGAMQCRAGRRVILWTDGQEFTVLPL